MEQIAEFSTPDETKILNELLSENKEKYSLYDIFKYLPFDITYNGNRGYLSISQLGIEYTSLNYNYTLNIVHIESTNLGSISIFECFIKTLRWYNENKEAIKINF